MLVFHSNEPGNYSPESQASGILKRCPLCGVLNTHSENVCVCCGWRGVFECSAESVREALFELYAQPDDEELDLATWQALFENEDDF